MKGQFSTFTSVVNVLIAQDCKYLMESHDYLLQRLLIFFSVKTLHETKFFFLHIHAKFSCDSEVGEIRILRSKMACTRYLSNYDHNWSVDVIQIFQTFSRNEIQFKLSEFNSWKMWRHLLEFKHILTNLAWNVKRENCMSGVCNTDILNVISSSVLCLWSVVTMFLKSSSDKLSCYAPGCNTDTRLYCFRSVHLSVPASLFVYQQNLTFPVTTQGTGNIADFQNSFGPELFRY